MTNETFVKAVSSSAHEKKLSTFVLSSILTVDDFLQFKAMMVKRNMDLTNEVLEANMKGGQVDIDRSAMQSEDDGNPEAVSVSSSPSAPPAPKTPESTTPTNCAPIGISAKEVSPPQQKDSLSVQESETKGESASFGGTQAYQYDEEDELTRALAMSREQFALEQRLLDERSQDQARQEYSELSAAVKMSLRESCRLEGERAEIEQAIALSLALEEERKRLEEEYTKQEEEQIQRVMAIEEKERQATLEAEAKAKKEEEAKKKDEADIQVNAKVEEAVIQIAETLQDELLKKEGGEEEEEQNHVGADLTSAISKSEEIHNGEEIEIEATKSEVEGTMEDTEERGQDSTTEMVVAADINSPNITSTDNKENTSPPAVLLQRKNSQPVTLPALSQKDIKQMENLRRTISLSHSSNASSSNATNMSDGDSKKSEGHLLAAPRPLSTLRRGSGFSSSLSTKEIDLSEVRVAASAAANSQKALLHRKAAAVKEAQAAVQIVQQKRKSMSALSAREKEFIAQQRKELVARKARGREEELKKYLSDQGKSIEDGKGKTKMLFSNQDLKSSSSMPSADSNCSNDVKRREELRLELAKCVKHELISRMANSAA